MLLLNNEEGIKFNGQLDNYLVVSLINQAKEDINYGQLEWIVEVASSFHTEELVIEADLATSDVVDFLINIEKLSCSSRKEIGMGTYYIVNALN